MEDGGTSDGGPLGQVCVQEPPRGHAEGGGPPSRRRARVWGTQTLQGPWVPMVSVRVARGEGVLPDPRRWGK